MQLMRLPAGDRVCPVRDQGWGVRWNPCPADCKGHAGGGGKDLRHRGCGLNHFPRCDGGLAPTLEVVQKSIPGGNLQGHWHALCAAVLPPGDLVDRGHDGRDQDEDCNAGPALHTSRNLRMAVFPPSRGGGERRDGNQLVHLCHGALGHVLLLVKVYEVFDNIAFLEWAEGIARVVVCPRGQLKKGTFHLYAPLIIFAN